MKRFFPIFIVILIFYFVFIPDIKQDTYKVLDVVGNEYFYIDFNKNNKTDDNELVKIEGVKTFPVKYSADIQLLASKFKLSESEIRTLAFLSERYLKENFKGKYVKVSGIKNSASQKDVLVRDGAAQNNTTAQNRPVAQSSGAVEILLNNTPVSTYLLKNGLGYIEGDFSNIELIRRRIKNSKIMEYFIFDTENEILHNNNCPETKNIKKFSVVKKSELEFDIKKCQKCFSKRINTTVSKVLPNITYPPFFKKENITLYLNNPYKYNSPSNSPRAEVCKFIIKEIKNAKKNVYFSIYGVDNQNEIVNTLIAAKKKGLEVLGVSDSDEKGVPAYNDMFKFKNIINITYDNKKSIMHNKFFVIDDNLIITGSMNISKTGCGGYNSNSVAVIKNKIMNNAYKNEFLQMKKGVFKNLKKDYSVSSVKINSETEISAYFSPSNDIYKSAFEKEIKKAKKNIRMSIFVLTYDNIANDLIKAKEKGVNVRVIIDASGASSHKRLVNKMRENGIKVKIENWGGKNHEKTMSIDDNVLIMGSANFSYAAITKNDENLLVIKDKDITKFYNGFFDLLYNAIPDKYLSRFVRAEGFDSVNSCNDGIDNNFDGKIDSNDLGCKK